MTDDLVSYTDVREALVLILGVTNNPTDVLASLDDAVSNNIDEITQKKLEGSQGLPESWDLRDMELNLRDSLAQIIAEIVSGCKGAIPEQVDFDIADDVRDYIERIIRAKA